MEQQQKTAFLSEQVLWIQDFERHDLTTPCFTFIYCSPIMHSLFQSYSKQ